MEFTFFSSAHGIFSRTDHILGHKSSLGKFKKNWNHSKYPFRSLAVRLNVNYREKKKTIKNTNIWRLNNTLLNNQQITEEIKKEINICIETNESKKNDNSKPMGFSKIVLRGRFIAIQAYLKKQEKHQITI